MNFASTRPVQIGTTFNIVRVLNVGAFASTRPVQIATPRPQSTNSHRGEAFASTRPVQIATAEMHRIAICTFQNVC